MIKTEEVNRDRKSQRETGVGVGGKERKAGKKKEWDNERKRKLEKGKGRKKKRGKQRKKKRGIKWMRKTKQKRDIEIWW